GEDRKQRLLVNDLRTKTVDHTDCPRAICIEQGGMLSHKRQILINQKPLVNNIYFKIAKAQTAVAEFKFVRRSDDRRMALSFKILAEQFELFLRRHAFQIDDRDLRRTFRFPAQEFLVAVDENRKHQAPPLESPQVVFFGKAFHHRQLCKNLERRISIRNAGGALAVQLDKAIGIVSEK